MCLCVEIFFPSFYIPFSKITNQIHIKWVCLLPKKIYLNEISRLSLVNKFVWLSSREESLRSVSSYIKFMDNSFVNLLGDCVP